MHASWYERNKDYQRANAKKHRIESRTAAKEYIWNYLLTHPCISCGETEPVVLEFHHRHGKDKAVTEMAVAGYPISTIQAEIGKCDVLCANGHRRLTAKERGWFRGRKVYPGCRCKSKKDKQFQLTLLEIKGKWERYACISRI